MTAAICFGKNVSRSSFPFSLDRGVWCIIGAFGLMDEEE
jgi:hypothetical protein